MGLGQSGRPVACLIRAGGGDSLSAQSSFSAYVTLALDLPVPPSPECCVCLCLWPPRGPRAGASEQRRQGGSPPDNSPGLRCIAALPRGRRPRARANRQMRARSPGACPTLAPLTRGKKDTGPAMPFAMAGSRVASARKSSTASRGAGPAAKLGVGQLGEALTRSTAAIQLRRLCSSGDGT